MRFLRSMRYFTSHRIPDIPHLTGTNINLALSCSINYTAGSDSPSCSKMISATCSVSWHPQNVDSSYYTAFVFHRYKLCSIPFCVNPSITTPMTQILYMYLWIKLIRWIGVGPNFFNPSMCFWFHNPYWMQNLNPGNTFFIFNHQ